MSSGVQPSPHSPPGIWRRLGAILYDSLLLTGVLFLATAIALPFNNGRAFDSGQLCFPIYLLVVSFLFFGWFWTHGGQTLGMRTWKIRVFNADKRPVTWKQALARFLVSMFSWAALGIGFLWMLASKNNHTWHDMASGSHIDWAEIKDKDPVN